MQAAIPTPRVELHAARDVRLVIMNCALPSAMGPAKRYVRGNVPRQSGVVKQGNGREIVRRAIAAGRIIEPTRILPRFA
jgi:hypothetical protein